VAKRGHFDSIRSILDVTKFIQTLNNKCDGLLILEIDRN